MRPGRRAAASASAMAVFSFIFMLFLGAIFSTIGGLLGAVIFAQEDAARRSSTFRLRLVSATSLAETGERSIRV